MSEKQIPEIRALEVSAAERMLFPELWRHEPWAHTSSNVPYQIAPNDTVGEATRKQARAAFLNGDGEEPALTFPQLDRNELAIGLTRFDDMLSRLQVRPNEQPLLFEAISRKHAELSRHRYVLDAMEATDPQERDTYRGYAEQLSVELFGDVDPAVLNGMLLNLKEQAGAYDNDYARELVEMLPATDETAAIPEQQLMTEETIEKLRPLILEYFHPALEIADTIPGGELEHEQSVELLQRMLDAMGFEGAKAVLTTGGAMEAVGLQLRLGRNRSKLSKETFRTAVLHELTHMSGSWHGRQQKDGLLAVGLPGILAFEEGKSVGIEQIMRGAASKIRGEQYYIALGLQRGSLDGHKHSFRETFEVMWRRALVQDGNFSDEAVTKARAAAYRTVMRTRRGLAADARDISYYMGNSKASAWFNSLAELPEDRAAELLQLTLTTKADPTKTEHLDYLEQHDKQWQEALKKH